MGWSLKYHLLRQFEKELDFLERLFDEEDQYWYIETKPGIFGNEFEYDENRQIPGWKEMIMYWSSGWSSFGLKYPGHKDLTIAPIVKAVLEPGEEPQPLLFYPH